MTNAQLDALESAEKILGEHFDSFLLCLDTTNVNDENDHAFNYLFNCGESTALGLAESLKISIHLRAMQAMQDKKACQDNKSGEEAASS